MVPLLAYFRLRTRRGSSCSAPTRPLSPVVAAAVIPIAGGERRRPDRRWPAMLAILVGVIMIVGGLTRFGFITDLLSKPVGSAI